VNARSSWAGYQAAHIFPLAYEGHWIHYNYGQWITIQPNRGGPINSVQNGILLRSDLHILFDAYDVTINPDDNYKVVCFNTDGNGVAGKHIDFGDDECRPVDQLLRWHFRQAVIANMRGAGEAWFECDFPPGSDIMGDILNGPMAAERMEYELFSRVASRSKLCTYSNRSMVHRLLDRYVSSLTFFISLKIGRTSSIPQLQHIV